MPVKVDGVVVGTAANGVSRLDVCSAYAGRPGCPNVGFTNALDTTQFEPWSALADGIGNGLEARLRKLEYSDPEVAMLLVSRGQLILNRSATYLRLNPDIIEAG